MATVKELINDLELKSDLYNKNNLPTHLEPNQKWIKDIDGDDGKCYFINEDKTKMYKYNSIYVSTLVMNTYQFLWGYTNEDLPKTMKEKTIPLIEIGKRKGLIEFTEDSLIVEPNAVEMQQNLRENNNKENCERLSNQLYSKYHWNELIALAAKALKAESFLIIEYPKFGFDAIYFLYGEPEIIEI